MSDAMGPEWTEKLDAGRIIDPLQVDRVRNRMLTDLLFGIVSIQIYQRLRYISFTLWCLDHLEEPEQDELIALEKVFLLANVAHEHTGKDRGENGLSGASNVPWDADEFHTDATESFPITDDVFKIQDSGSSGFYQYYRSIMERLLLIDGLEPTPLGCEIAAAFDESVDVAFDEVAAAAQEETVPRDLILQFGSDACCCLLDGQEEALLRDAYFGLITPASAYSDLTFTAPADAPELALGRQLAEEEALAVLEVPDDVLDIDDYLERYFDGNFGAKMRDSLLFFLWVAEQKTTGAYQPAASVEQFADIREMWRLFRFYEYFNYGCESLLSAVLWTLRTEDAVQPDELLTRIVSNPIFRETVHDILHHTTFDEGKEAADSLTVLYQYAYYGEAVAADGTVHVERSGDTFTGSWSDLVDAVAEQVDLAAFDVDASLSEWRIIWLIDDVLANPTGEAINVSSRIFAYVTVLFAFLKARHQDYVSTDDQREYWEWLTLFEDAPPGPVSLLQWLEHNDDLDDFMHSCARRWGIDQYDKALYEKMDPSRMPRLFSRDITGKIDFQEMWEPRLSETKFERMVDILYDLGLIEAPEPAAMRISDEGKTWLRRFAEDDQ